MIALALTAYVSLFGRPAIAAESPVAEGVVNAPVDAVWSAWTTVEAMTIKTPKTFPFPTAIRQTWTVVYLEPAGSGRTKVTVRMVGFGDDAESQKMRAFFESGNKATIDALVKKFQ